MRYYIFKEELAKLTIQADIAKKAEVQKYLFVRKHLNVTTCWKSGLKTSELQFLVDKLGNIGITALNEVWKGKFVITTLIPKNCKDTEALVPVAIFEIKCHASPLVLTPETNYNFNAVARSQFKKQQNVPKQQNLASMRWIIQETIFDPDNLNLQYPL